MRARSKVLARTLSAAAAAAALLTGCFTVGRDFPTRPVQRIEVGQTTHEDVAGWFGRPWRQGLENGQRTWTYGHYRYSVFGEAQTRDLVVSFDDQGIVTSYSFNSTHPEDTPR